jgi:5-methylcytosine-specific restriction enzyme A
MNSFVITYKPATENPERGWPLKDLQKLVISCRAGGRPIEPWRFNNRKNVSLEDRVFLLLQGKTGPAIIGYGKVVGRPDDNSGAWRVPVQFESLADPTIEEFVSKNELLGMKKGLNVWRTQSSGVILPESVAAHLEELVVGNAPKRRTGEPISNPDWTRDELILALNFYLQHRPNPPRTNSEEIGNLSSTLKRLGERLFPATSRAGTFRNEKSVYMKLMNFRRLDPQYTVERKSGLERGAKGEEEVWAEFSSDVIHCEEIARAIVAALDGSDVVYISSETEIDDDMQEAQEGRLLTRVHFARERNRQLVVSKRKQVMTKHGKLTCEACGFDFAIYYRGRGEGFIECHHTKPVHTLPEEHTTHLDDLALVCANCHRMIHRTNHWLTIADLRALIARSRP